jgi:glycosyltransferase involved in cell wall biosynthesis
VYFLIRGFAALTKIRRNVVFILVGDGPITDQLKALAKSLALQKIVIFTGAVPHSNLAPYYQAADLFVFSSLTDTQGIVVLEAIGSGLRLWPSGCCVYADGEEWQEWLPAAGRRVACALCPACRRTLGESVAPTTLRWRVYSNGARVFGRSAGAKAHGAL